MAHHTFIINSPPFLIILRPLNPTNSSFKLLWSVIIVKQRPSKYCLHFFIAAIITNISRCGPRHKATLAERAYWRRLWGGSFGTGLHPYQPSTRPFQWWREGQSPAGQGQEPEIMLAWVGQRQPGTVVTNWIPPKWWHGPGELLSNRIHE